VHARYAFRRHFYQHAGFRYIESDAPLKIQTADYVTEEDVTRSCELNWGVPPAGEEHFAVTLAHLAGELLPDNPDARILDLNADTGRLAFELARRFRNITALDFTARMIRVPIQLQEQGYVRYTMKDEGELLFYRDIVLSDYGLSEAKEHILFMQEDAMNLKPIFSGYDLIILPNLLEELSDPLLFLSNIHSRVNDSGYLLLASSYEWDREKTPRDKWPGGFKRDGEPVTSLDGIRDALATHFTLCREPEEIMLTLKKSTRTSEQRRVQVTRWKKK
jgi:putative 4-mercaptohistidine N1-methyltranferase